MEIEGFKEVQEEKIDTALLMAAGMGTRIRPISENIPKPLIPVLGRPMIETMIVALKSAGIDNIIISIGYKKEKYFYLKDKYDNIRFVENKEYEYKNTISSFYAAKDLIRDKNCIICESDLYVGDPSIIRARLDKSRYFLRKVGLQNHEWGFELEKDRVMKVVRPLANKFLDHHMYGIAYWLKDDLNKLIEEVEKAYQSPGHEGLAYDEIGNKIFQHIDMGTIEVQEGQVYEIDSMEDLLKVDNTWGRFFRVVN